METDTSNNSIIKNPIVILIILLGAILRFYFYTGHIYSDDAYYTYLSYTIYSGNFAHDYLGYPVFLLRIGQTGLTAFSFMIFGTNEIASILFPFIISIINIPLTYNITFLITGNQKSSLISAFLMAIFPTDVVFATINFPDLINMFLINLGIYLLLKSYLKNNLTISVAAGLAIFLSMQFKENAYYFAILFLTLLIYLFIKQKKLNKQLFLALVFICLNFLTEGIYYLIIQHDIFYRILITAENYKYSYYDFFPYTAQKFSGTKSYIKNLFDQVFIINLKSVFLRRFYLFIPITGLIQSIINVKKKEFKLLSYWFFGIAILLVAFTTSFTEYKPLDLQRSWYIYPMIMPSVILTAIFLSRFKKVYLIPSLFLLFIGSIIMCSAYENYFQKFNNQQLNNFLIKNSDRLIVTDHFTKYSVDLIRGYKNNSLSKRFKDVNNFTPGTLILFNNEHINELKMQGFKFDDFNFKDNKFRLVESIGDFRFYEVTGRNEN